MKDEEIKELWNRFGKLIRDLEEKLRILDIKITELNGRIKKIEDGK